MVLCGGFFLVFLRWKLSVATYPWDIQWDLRILRQPPARWLVPEHRAEGPRDVEGQKDLDIAGSACTLPDPLDLHMKDLINRHTYT